MNAHLQHVAVVTWPAHDDFTVSASTFCEFYLLPRGEYGFEAHELSGKEVAKMTGTYSECRYAWESVAGNALPYEIDRRRV